MNGAVLESLWSPFCQCQVLGLCEVVVLKSRLASPAAILGNNTFRARKETGGWEGDRIGLDDVES